MNTLVKILVFLIVNTLGFLVAPFSLVMSVKLGLIDLSHPEFDIEAFRADFLHTTYLTWLACALFSFAYFFFKGKERYFFLLAPLVMPLFYWFSVILGLFGA